MLLVPKLESKINNIQSAPILKRGGEISHGGGDGAEQTAPHYGSGINHSLFS